MRIAFLKIKDVLDQATIHRITPEQLRFRLIQAKEQFDPQQIEDTNINALIKDLNSF